MFVTKQIVKFLQLLHSETSRNQLSAGLVLGMFMGFTPMFTLHWMLYWVLLFIFRFNIGAVFLSYGLFKLFSFGFDPVFHKVGIAMLSSASLRGFWVFLYNVSVLPYTRFNNSVVMGSLVICVTAALPFFFLFNLLIEKYRNTVVARFKTTWLFRAWKASGLYSLYAKYNQVS